MAETPRKLTPHTTPCGTCYQCGESVFGDGDIATKNTGGFLCLVCFLDPHLMRETMERSGLMDMKVYDDMAAQTRTFVDECRGHELRRRAARETGR